MKMINTRWVARLSVVRRGTLLREAKIDGDAIDVEVYGRTKDVAARAPYRCARISHGLA